MGGERRLEERRRIVLDLSRMPIGKVRQPRVVLHFRFYEPLYYSKETMSLLKVFVEKGTRRREKVMTLVAQIVSLLCVQTSVSFASGLLETLTLVRLASELKCLQVPSVPLSPPRRSPARYFGDM